MQFMEVGLTLYKPSVSPPSSKLNPLVTHQVVPLSLENTISFTFYVDHNEIVLSQNC